MLGHGLVLNHASNTPPDDLPMKSLNSSLSPCLRLRAINLLTCTALLAVQFTLLPTSAQADTLYGATGASNTTSSLFTLDSTTGATLSTIGPIGFGITGLAVDPLTQVIYGATNSNSALSPNSLITINPTTGLGTLVGSFGNVIGDLSFNSAGVLFGSGQNSLQTINLATGALTNVGGSFGGSGGTGLAFNAAGTLYFSGNGDTGALKTVNPATGITTTVATLSGIPNHGNIAALAFDSAGNLIGVDLNSGVAHLVKINTTTGAMTDLGTSLAKLDGIALSLSSSNLPQQSALTTGLPMANVEGQMLINAGSVVTSDLNGHLFNLRAGDGEEDADGSLTASMDNGVVVGQGDGDPDAKSPIARTVKRSRQWEVFTTVGYGNVKLNAFNNQAGVQVDSWAPSVGIERHLSRGLAVGFATTFLTSDQSYTGGLGRLHLEGPALSAYVSFARKNFWSSLLYSFGSYQLDSTRNPGIGFAQAMGTTRTYTNSVQYNTGWNFRFQNNTLVTGPFAGIDYLYGTVRGYSETGGGMAALNYGRQTYESLVTRVGWSSTKKIQTNWALITPQVRLSYERQNLTNNGTSVSLINAPFTAAGGNQSPGQSYMVAGGGVNFQFTDQFGMLLSYQGQFFRNNMQAHFGSVRLSYKF